MRPQPIPGAGVWNSLELPGHSFGKMVQFTRPARPAAVAKPQPSDKKRLSADDTHGAALERAAVPRLRILGVVFAAFAMVLLGIALLVDSETIAVPFSGEIRYGALAAALAGSCVMIAVTHAGSWQPRRVIAIGLVFQVFGAFCISYLEQGVAGLNGASLVCIWILSFTLVPTTARRAALAAYASAASAPAIFAIGVASGHRVWSATTTEALQFGITFVAATIAVVTAKVIYGLNREVADARRLGSYVMVELLGKGGMGEVWRAEHQSLVRPAAVKLLRRELTSHLSESQVNAMNLRFQREVQATAQLTSPHTVAVYDFGQTTDGILYYVMELLNGLDAETLVRDHGPQPAERVVYLMRQACESLAEAHHRKLVHRDIKPANTYLGAVGMDVDFVKVLDFGLVHDLDHDTRLTVEGSISGTPAYLAPESAAHNQFDARSDIYALGCVAYWLLTGTVVFDGDTSAAVMAAHIRDQPEPPSWRTELPIPPELEAIIMSCLAKHPEDRPASAEELSRLLAEVPFYCPWNRDRAESWWRAHVPHLLAKARIGCDVIELSQVRRRPSFVIRNSVAS
jgi:serine/threonine-protein kinase